MTIKAADLFCGAGGFSTGAVRACRSRGMSIDLTAVDHWPVAIATHTRNHPGARHLCADVYRLSPREAVPKGSLDLLMASPTCTFFSRARGGKPISRDQRYGRMTPTQVIRWASELKAGAVVVENVPEFQDWGPVDVATGRPKKAKRGQYFRAWRKKLERMGFRIEYRVLNAADYGDATTRQRLFLIGRRDGGSVRWPTPTHSENGSSDLFGSGEQRWRPAREIIDWSLPGRSIFGRKKPLSLKTLARIYAGAERFGWPRAFLVVLRQHMDALELSGPLPTVTTKARFGVTVPTTHGGSESRAYSLEKPLPTVTAANRGEMAFVTAAFGERPGQSARVQSLDQPLSTICATGGVPRLVSPSERELDIRFRMLQPHELARAMSFDDYSFAGNKTDIIRQIGNAVPVRTAAALVGAVLEAV
jgi:DNA (cytosine-5)-methyltransferase 1